MNASPVRGATTNDRLEGAAGAGSLRRDVAVGRVGVRFRKSDAVQAEPFEMKGDRLAHFALDLFAGSSGRDATGYVRGVGGVTRSGFSTTMSTFIPSTPPVSERY